MKKTQVNLIGQIPLDGGRGVRKGISEAGEPGEDRRNIKVLPKGAISSSVNEMMMPKFSLITAVLLAISLPIVRLAPAGGSETVGRHVT